MGGKGVASKRWFFAVGAVFAVLVVALMYSGVSFTLVLRDKDLLIDSLKAEVVNLGGDPSQLLSAGDKDAQIAALLVQLADKSAEIEALCAAKLVAVDLRADDTRLDLNAHYVRVRGYVVNVGNDTAENSRVHVILQQAGGVVAKDTYVALGSLGAESFASVDEKIHYEGGEITFASMNLEWT